jgi:eukaryotic-like serine/threonine-protein kinase
MSLAPGVRLGAYEIISLIGAGGMGEVYRARDTRLKRDVAIKILPDTFADDTERLARFQREAEVVAALNHPNIAQIYGVEDRALVLELVDGPTLADCIAQGPVRLEEAVLIARQIAEALEAAHERGIIHRDLKPANIKLTPNGTVKVLDFGLAKAVDRIDGQTTINSPSLTMGGVILGTASYMSPEQAKGKPVDKRTDIWAFGCVLYEMITGKPVFDGEGVTDVLARILEQEPDYRAVSNAPSSIQKLLRRCLEKDRRRRMADIADARFELDEAAEVKDRPTGGRQAWWIGASLALLLALTIAVAIWILAAPRSAPQVESLRFTLNLPPGITMFGSVAVSPDGRYLAFNAARADSPSSLWLRPLTALISRELPGTGGAFSPFWSPDSRFIGFLSDRTMKKVDLSGGAVSTIAASAFYEASWGAQGTILFSTRSGQLQRVSPTGSAPTVIASPVGEEDLDFPSFLPDGEHFLFADIRTLVPQRGAAIIYVASLKTGERRELLRADSRAVYANGHLLFVRDRSLMAQRFDTGSRALSGNAFPIAENVWAGAGGRPYFSASQTGVLAFPFQDTPTAQLTWLDRMGKQIGTVGNPGDFSNPRLSPDGKKLAVCLYDRSARSRDIWILDLERGSRARFTQDPADDMNPTWAADGSAIAFSSDRKGQRDIYRKAVQAGGDDQLVYTSSVNKSVVDWSPDGRHLLFFGPQAPGSAISLIDAAARDSSKPAVWSASAFLPSNPQFSPDGRWIAFSSTESGRHEIYVAPVSGAGGKVIVSTTGGIQPRWSRDGKEIFYLTLPRNALMTVPVATQGTSTFEAGAVKELFRFQMADALGSLYDVSPDGQRFLVNARVGEAIAPIMVVLNWTADLEK